MSDEQTITIKKNDLWKYSTFLLFAVVVVGGFFLLTGNNEGGGGTVTGTGNVVQQAPTQPAGKISASIDDDPFIGNEDAPVTIIEFSDYQCPFCGKFWRETLPSLKSEYIDTGKVKFVYRDFPLSSIHPLAIPAAEAAECVRDAAGGSDEVYFEYHDLIFTNQQSLSVTNLNAWAQQLGYNIDSCLESGKFRGEVQKDLADAQAAGGRGTPYFLVNGNPLEGAYPIDAFRQIIDAELA